MESNKDYFSLYHKYKNKYLSAKKNINGGSTFKNLTIDTNFKDDGEARLTPSPSPEPRTPTISYQFKEIVKPKIEGNFFIFNNQTSFNFEKIFIIKYNENKKLINNKIDVIENKFMTVFMSKSNSSIIYYYIDDYIESDMSEELEPLSLTNPKIYNELLGWPEYIFEKQISFMSDNKRIEFLDSHRIRKGEKEINLFVTDKGLEYFID